MAISQALEEQDLADKAKHFALHLFCEVLQSQFRPSALTYLHNPKQ